MYWHDSRVSRVESTLLSVALGGVITLAAYTDVVFVAVAVLVAQFMIAAAPAPSDERGRHVNSPRFGPAIAAAIVATILTIFPGILVGADGTRSGSVGFVSSGLMTGIAPGMAVGLFAALLGQMLRKDGRKSLVTSLSYSVTLCMFAVLPVAWIGASQSLGGAPLVALGAIAVGTALAAWLIPGNRVIIGSVAVLAAAGVTTTATLYISGPSNMGPLFGAAVGFGVGMFAILGQVLGRAWSEGGGHASSGWGFAGAMSLALSAPVVFIGSQFLGTTLML